MRLLLYGCNLFYISSTVIVFLYAPSESQPPQVCLELELFIQIRLKHA